MLRFAPSELTDAELALQAEVREFLAAELPRGSFAPGLGMCGQPRRGLLPRARRARLARHGAAAALRRRRTGVVDRFIVVEELLRWGAPVRYHWVADRQTGPADPALRHGGPARALPAGDLPRRGVVLDRHERARRGQRPGRRADARDAEWRAAGAFSGTKLWTGGAHENDWCVVLCRTSEEDDRHRGLTQLIVDLRAPGVTVRPIAYLDGSEFFNEVILDEVFVAEELVLGEVGAGWAQNTSELSFERAGPERWLSTLPGGRAVPARARRDDERARAALGEAVAGWWGIRALSLSVARLARRGRGAGGGGGAREGARDALRAGRARRDLAARPRRARSRRATPCSSGCSRRRSSARPRSRSAAARTRSSARSRRGRCAHDERRGARRAARARAPTAAPRARCSGSGCSARPASTERRAR